MGKDFRGVKKKGNHKEYDIGPELSKRDHAPGAQHAPQGRYGYTFGPMRAKRRKAKGRKRGR